MKGLSWKLISTVATGVAVLVAKQATDRTWEFTTGNPPPGNPENPDVDWKEAAAWALLSGAAIGLARLYATRGAAKFYLDQMGDLPKSVKQDVRPDIRLH